MNTNKDGWINQYSKKILRNLIPSMILNFKNGRYGKPENDL